MISSHKNNFMELFFVKVDYIQLKNAPQNSDSVTYKRLIETKIAISCPNFQQYFFISTA